MNKPFQKNFRFWIGIFLTVFEGFLSASIYMTLYILIKMLLYNQVTSTHIFHLTVVIILIFLIRLIAYGFGYTQGQVGGGIISRHIRLYLGDKLRKIPLSQFSKGQVGEYVNIMTSDVNQYEQILTHKIGNLVKNISLSILLLCFVCYLYLPAGSILLLVSLLFLPNMWLSFIIVKKYGTRRNHICAEAVSSIVEYMTGIRTLRAYQLCGTQNKKITHTLKKYSHISYQYEALGIPVTLTFNILTWLSLPVVMLIASKPWLIGSLTDVDYLMICMMPMLLAKLYMTISVDLFGYKNMLISKQKIQKMVFQPEEQGKHQKLQLSSYDICFQNVCFSYMKNESVLKNVSFEIEDGKLTAIVGDSGSGKSTILNLIAKYYDIDSGDILIGHQSIKDISSEHVLEHISMVDQDVFLFDDTIQNNIRYARLDATDEDIINACQLANCHDFIMKMENGYKTVIGENGHLLSGGERQRLSIARAILKNSPILLLDEATASLDIENELAVKKAIVNLLKNQKTVIMIAHTLSIVQNADQILVVSDGQIMEAGKHKELMEHNGKYASMWQAEQKLSV